MSSVSCTGDRQRIANIFWVSHNLGSQTSGNWVENGWIAVCCEKHLSATKIGIWLADTWSASTERLFCAHERSSRYRFMHWRVLLEEATRCALPWLPAWCLYYKYDGNVGNSQILHLLFQRGFDTVLRVRGRNDTAVSHNLVVLPGWFYGGIHFPGSSYYWNSGFQGNG